MKRIKSRNTRRLQEGDDIIITQWSPADLENPYRFRDLASYKWRVSNRGNISAGWGMWLQIIEGPHIERPGYRYVAHHGFTYIKEVQQ